MIPKHEGDRLVLPGLATAHSHAFQRALRVVVQMAPRFRDRTTAPSETFWSWRRAMYGLAETLDEQTLYAIARYAYTELAECGVTAVGEFHYVHHGDGGAPYLPRTMLSELMVRAAREVGLRVTLLRVVYERAGAQASLEKAQRRFVDASLEDAFDDVLTLRERFAGDDLVRVGIAPHSVRAVTRPSLSRIAFFARVHDLPVHMHVSEQPREIDECMEEHALRPVELIESVGLLDRRFVAVHATHLSEREFALLGENDANACICRTTERDLADGAPDVRALLDAGVRLSVGVDGYYSSCPFEELRAIELDERTRTGKRHAGPSATDLLEIASRNGYLAIGFEGHEQADSVTLDANDAAFFGTPADALAEAVVHAGSSRAVREVRVAGSLLVENGKHRDRDDARSEYCKALERLGM